MERHAHGYVWRAPRWLSQQSRDYKIQNVYLGKYISFVDSVTLDDIARAFQQALYDALGKKMEDGFACITHSTGGPVVRLWMKLYYGAQLTACPMKHLIMLAPANHGSALAQLGKGTFSRFKSLLEGEQPGVRVLDWLELGSEQAWNLNESWIAYDCPKAGIYPFVLTGQSIDRAFYDHLNSYTGEAGSDGVVRAAAANMNYTLMRLHSGRRYTPVPGPFRAQGGRARLSASCPVDRIQGTDGHPPQHHRSECAAAPHREMGVALLEVASERDYFLLCDELDDLTAGTQRDERVEKQKKFFGTRTFRTSRYSMILFKFVDDRGDVLTDYDLYLTAGPNYSPDDLPQGFFVDRQRNKKNPGMLTYYVDHDVLRRGLNKQKLEGRIGFRVEARPASGEDALAFYRRLEFKSDEDGALEILRPNETLMLEFKLQRWVDSTVFRIESSLKPSPIDKKPSGTTVP